jgi:hypothetical protein
VLLHINTNDYINISGLVSQANYVIYDIAGAIIKQGNLTNGQTKISTVDIVSGTYFLQFQIENKSIVKPIAIMH